MVDTLGSRGHVHVRVCGGEFVAVDVERVVTSGRYTSHQIYTVGYALSHNTRLSTQTRLQMTDSGDC